MAGADLNDRVVKSILRVAVDHRRSYPLCSRKWEATQASGSAVAGLSLGVIEDGLRDLREQMAVACGDLSKEKHYDDGHVIDHIYKVNVLIIGLLRLTGRPFSGRARPRRVNSAAQVFAQLPRQCTQAANERLDEVQETLNDAVKCISRAREKAREKEFEEAELLMTSDAVALLAATIEKLDVAVHEFETMRKDLTGVWKDSVLAIRQEAACRP